MYCLKSTEQKIPPSLLDKDQYTIYQEKMFGAERFHIIRGGQGTGNSCIKSWK